MERDYFPDLDILKEKLDYLKAKETNDVIKLREFYSKYSTGKASNVAQNVEDSPATFETPVGGHMNHERSATPIINYPVDDVVEPVADTKKDSKDDKSSQNGSEMSLDEFLEKHTSEDNESFEQIMEENEKRFRMKVRFSNSRKNYPDTFVGANKIKTFIRNSKNIMCNYLSI